MDHTPGSAGQVVRPGCFGMVDASSPGVIVQLRQSRDGSRAGLAASDHPGRVVCSGSVETDNDARRVLLAALAGAGIIAAASAPRETIDLLVDDLRRLGSVDHVTADIAPPGQLDPEQLTLLALLAEGLTLGEAAEQLGLPRRTADRRLAAARRALGTERTAEALARARRLGWLGRGAAG